MPATRHRRRRAWAAEFDQSKQEELLGGPGASLLAGMGYYPEHSANHLHEATPQEHAAARQAMSSDWTKHGPTLLEAWIADDPGTRPWAWWEFDAPEPRDPQIPEREQLRRLGQLTPAEITPGA